MMRKEANRAKYDVIRERYSSDLSAAEFALIILLSCDSLRRRGGSPPNHARRGALANVRFAAMAETVERRPWAQTDRRSMADAWPSDCVDF